MENTIYAYMQVNGIKAAVTEFAKRLEYYKDKRAKYGTPAPTDGRHFYGASLNMAWADVLKTIDTAFAIIPDGVEGTVALDPSFAWSSLSSMFVDECYDDTHELENVISLQAACIADGVDVAFDADGDGCTEMGEADRYGDFRIATKAPTSYTCRDCGDSDEISPTKEYDIGIYCDACGSSNVDSEKFEVNILVKNGEPCVAPLQSEGRNAA